MIYRICAVRVFQILQRQHSFEGGAYLFEPVYLYSSIFEHNRKESSRSTLRAMYRYCLEIKLIERMSAYTRYHR